MIAPKNSAPSAGSPKKGTQKGDPKTRTQSDSGPHPVLGAGDGTQNPVRFGHGGARRGAGRRARGRSQVTCHLGRRENAWAGQYASRRGLSKADVINAALRLHRLHAQAK